MRKSTKGALAAAAAGTMLLGGAGSLAYWNSTDTLHGSSIQSGSLSLTQVTCGDWQLDGSSGDLGSRKIIPGDSLTKTCTYTLHAEGDHLAGEVNVTAPTWSGALKDKLTLGATFDLGGTTITPGTAVAFTDGADQTLTANLSVTFPFGGLDNTSKGLTAALADITVTATQTDSHTTS